MGKFVLKDLRKKARALRGAIKLKAIMKGKQGLYVFYSIWFSTIKEYIKGKPSWTYQQAWKLYVIPFIPRDWRCTDPGFMGVKAKVRCKKISKELREFGEVKVGSKRWLQDELLPSFEKDFLNKNMDFNALGDIPEDKIKKKVLELKKGNKFKEMLK